MKGYCIYCKQVQVEMSDKWICVDCSKVLRGKI